MLSVDLMVALAVSTIFVYSVMEMAHIADDIFFRSKYRQAMIGNFLDADASNNIETELYGNERNRSIVTFASSTLEFRKVTIGDVNIDDLSKPLCSPVFEQITSIRPIMLPVDPNLPLTDIEVRNGIAYVSADSSVYADHDMFIFDIKGQDVSMVSSLNTGPGIAQFAIYKDSIFAAAASSAFQLHIMKMGPERAISLVTKFELPLPPSTTPPFGSAISMKGDLVVLGTEKWSSRELIFIDARDMAHPEVIGAFEIGSKVNSIDIEKNKAYVSASGLGQLIEFDISDPRNTTQYNSFEPSGWQRQVGVSSDRFETERSFARNSGGYNILTDHELFIWKNDEDYILDNEYDSIDLPGGAYGFANSKTHLALTSRTVDKELMLIRKPVSSTTLLNADFFPLPVAPQTMTCDNDKLYILAKTAPYIYEAILR